MQFASDNWAGAHPAVSENLSRHTAGFAAAYGTSDIDRKVEQTFNEIFEREVAVFFVATGTAANSLSLAATTRPGGLTLCHREAHIMSDEGGAPEFLAAGGRLHPVDGELGRISAAGLEREIARFLPTNVHSGRPTAVSLTQATEIGTVYDLDQIQSVSDVARRHGLPVHLDGARFANALVSLNASAADMTWKRGVDIVSFGGTKNGCWCAEAVVFMNPEQANDFAFIRKRAAHLFSKSRFISAQFEAYFRDDLWLETARHANEMTARLASHIRQLSKIRLAWEPQANAVFAILDAGFAESLKSKGAMFHFWSPPRKYLNDLAPNEALARLVTSFATSADDIDRFGELIA